MNKMLSVIGVLLLLFFVAVGIMLMVRSESIYEQSLTQSNKLIDAGLQNKLPIVLPPSYSTIKDGYAQALTFFMLAFGIGVFIVLLPRLQNISIGPGGVNVTLREVQKNLESLMQQANSLQAQSAGAGGPKAGTPVQKQARNIVVPEENDPQKNKWGGKPERNFRKLSAQVSASQWPDFYSVIITVESTNPEFPLIGVVKFHLHDTFKNPDPVIAASNNRAVLNLPKVSGPFTVGAELDNGNTRLELDLSTLDDTPKGFK